MLHVIKRRKEKNIDRIRKMSAEELADVLNSMLDYCPAATDGKVYCDKTDCKPCIVTWLNAGVK